MTELGFNPRLSGLLLDGVKPQGLSSREGTAGQGQASCWSAGVRLEVEGEYKECRGSCARGHAPRGVRPRGQRGCSASLLGHMRTCAHSHRHLEKARLSWSTPRPITDKKWRPQSGCLGDGTYKELKDTFGVKNMFVIVTATIVS